MNLPIKVLYVDDDPTWREIIGGILSKMNYHVEYASSHLQALDLLRQSFFHIALLDKRLVEEDAENEEGLEIAKFIVGLKEGTRVIMFTAHGDIDDVRTALLDIGVSDFLDKNAATSVIKKSIQRFVDKVLVDIRLPSRRSEEILTVRNTVLNQFLSRLKPELEFEAKARRLELFSKRLLSELRPLLPDRRAADIIQVGSAQVLRVRFWSKMLGSPIAALFGEFDQMKSVLDNIDSDDALRSSLHIKNKIAELFDSSTFPEFGGAVFELRDTKFEEFVLDPDPIPSPNHERK